MEIKLCFSNDTYLVYRIIHNKHYLTYEKFYESSKESIW